MSLLSFPQHCSDFIYPMPVGSHPENIVSARSMDYNTQMDGSIVGIAAGTLWTSAPPPGREGSGYSWTNKFSILGVDVVDTHGLYDKDTQFRLVEAINSAGLSISVLTTAADYRTAEQLPPDTENIVRINDTTLLISGTCAHVEDVKTLMKTINVWDGGGIYPFKSVPGAHFAIHDASGESVVIEFTKDEGNWTQVHNNPKGVLTNTHILHADMEVQKYNDIDNLTTQSMPGGNGSEDRFARLRIETRIIESTGHVAAGRYERMASAANLIKNVCVLRGTSPFGRWDLEVETRWTIVRDHTNLEVWINTYEDPNYRKFVLSEIPFTDEDQFFKMPLMQGRFNPPDCTSDLKPTHTAVEGWIPASSSSSSETTKCVLC